LQALEHRERRRQQFTLLAVVPTPTCDRRLDGGDQELGRRPSVTRFHRRAADPGEPFIQKSPEPSAPTRSPTTDSIRAKLIPRDSDDFRRSYSRWLSLTPRGRPLRIQIKPRRIEASVLALAIVKNDNLLQKGVFARRAVGSECNLIILDAGDVLHDAFAIGVQVSTRKVK
jgi:hypothetical protein